MIKKRNRRNKEKITVRKEHTRDRRKRNNEYSNGGNWGKIIKEETRDVK